MILGCEQYSKLGAISQAKFNLICGGQATGAQPNLS
jgi:hypothetical protein